MGDNLPALLQPFAARKPARGSAYVLKGRRLALADSRSALLGVDEGKMSASFVISTDDPDRVDDVVTTKGIHLANFKANPICFFGHQVFPLPIGKWATRDGDRCTIRLEEHRATGTVYFSQKSKQAAEVFDLVVEGILRATSIGFNPMEEPVARDGRKANPISLQRGFVFPKVDLLEVSIVGIPAQPTATLVREYLDGAKGLKLSEPIRKSLEPLAEARPAWSNGATMSKKWKKRPPAAVKAPPPPKKPQQQQGGDQQQADPNQQQAPPQGQPQAQQPQQQQPGQQTQQPQAMQEQSPSSDPKEVLGRLVDALTDYLDITSAAADSGGPGDPDMGEPSGLPEEDEGGTASDDDADGYAFDGDAFDGDADEAEGEDDEGEEAMARRYQQRAGKPAAQKGHRVCKACHAKLCKSCQKAMGGDDVPAPESGDAVDADADADEPVEIVEKGIYLDTDIDLEAIAAALRPVRERANAVGNAWQSLQGTMPQ